MIADLRPSTNTGQRVGRSEQRCVEDEIRYLLHFLSFGLDRVRVKLVQIIASERTSLTTSFPRTFEIYNPQRLISDKLFEHSYRVEMTNTINNQSFAKYKTCIGEDGLAESDQVSLEQ